MESRKKILRGISFEAGAKVGRHMVNIIITYNDKVDAVIGKQEKRYHCYLNKEYESLAESYKEKTIQLYKDSTKDYPKGIKNYFKRVNKKIVDEAVDTFSQKMKEMQYFPVDSFDSIDIKGILNEYKADLSSKLCYRDAHLPKKIEKYRNDDTLTINTMVKDEIAILLKKWVDENKQSYFEVSEGMADNILNELGDELIDQITTGTVKLAKSIKQPKYNVMNKLSVEEQRPAIKEFLVEYWEGVLSEYNKINLDGIHKFIFESLPYFDEEGEVQKDFLREIDDVQQKFIDEEKRNDILKKISHLT